MIIGEPYRFAIIFDRVDEWNDRESSLNNGVLFISVNGMLFPNILSTATLSVDINNLVKMFNSLESQIVDNKLFNKDKTLLFKSLFNKTFPIDTNIDNDYTYYITPPTLQDEHYFIFGVRGNDSVRILACKLEYSEILFEYCLDDINVEDATVSLSQLLNISEYLSEYSNNNL